MRRTSRSLVFAAVGWLATSCGAASLPTPAPTPPPQACDGTPTGTADELAAEYAATVHPLLLRSSAEGGCVSCHGPQAAGRFTVRDREPPRVTFEHLVRTGLLASSGPDTLVDRLGRSDTLRMPLGGPTWSAEERASITRLACRVEVSGLTSSCGALDPGTVPLRRLANAEYDRTVASALLAPGRPSERLAADQPTFGFDNVSRDQTFDVGRLERYRDVAEGLAEDTVVPPRGVEVTREAEGLSAFTHWGDPVGPGQGSRTSEGWRFERIKSRLSVGLVQAPYAGAYTVEVWARGTSANHYTCQNPMTTPPVDACQLAMVGPPPWGSPWRQEGTAPVLPKLEVGVDGRPTLIDVQASARGPFTKYAVTVDLEAGFHSLDVGLFNVVSWSREVLDVTLEVDRVTWKGPAVLPGADAARLQRFLRRCQAYGCGALAVRDVLETLWRRPVTPAEVDRYGPLLTDAAAAGEPFSEGLAAVLSAALLSPEFVFRPELDPQPGVPQSRPLTGFELATRLSYFLWGGPPDELLLAKAGDGSLVTDEGLRAQVDRLLADVRARALVDRFAWQWLELDKLRAVRPISPDFDEPLRAAFVGELRALLTDAFEQDRPVTELIESPRVFANARLARFYGLDAGGLGEDTFVPLPPGASGRGGLLASGGVLAMTSFPARTSPTVRGAWLLDRLFCRPPGAPPPVVPPLGPTALTDGGVRSVREVLDLHASTPQCAGCHANMDPLGLALEGYDELGRARTRYPGGAPVETTATLSSGEVLTGLRDVSRLVASDEGFRTCVTRKLLVYALGADPSRFDACAFDDVRARFTQGGSTFKALVRAVVMSPMFRARRPATPGEAGQGAP